MQKYAFEFQLKGDGIYRVKLGSFSFHRLDARRTYISDKEREYIRNKLGAEIKIIYARDFSSALNRAHEIEYTK